MATTQNDFHCRNRAIRVVKYIYPALKALHKAGWAHLDLKPENIGINQQNIPILLDFGLSRKMGTTLSTGFGSMEYMAPEREEITTQVAPTLDLYAFGVTVYELLYDAIPDWDNETHSPYFPHPPPKLLKNKITRWLHPQPERRLKRIQP